MPSTHVLLGAVVHTGGSDSPLVDTAVIVEGGRIAAVVPTRDAPARGAARVTDLQGAHLAPGFVDLQVNGGGGVMLNDEPTPDAVRRIARAHRRFGTTGLLPTFITGSEAGMRAAADAVHAVRQAAPLGTSGVLGVHFEGPFLDPRKPGAHDEASLRDPNPADLATITAAARDGAAVLLTLAACRYDADTAATLAAAGVRVSLGHCAATSDEARAAFARGATFVTHLFNAMSPLTSREAGLVGAALEAAARGRAHVGLILDGVHVAYDVAGVALRAAGAGGVFLVTDAVAPVGAEPPLAAFELGGQTVTVQGGRCVNAAGALAGSALDMATAVRNARGPLGLDLDEALRMASTYPAAAVGLSARKGRIRAGYDADLVWFDDDVRVLGTLIGGASESDVDTAGADPTR